MIARKLIDVALMLLNVGIYCKKYMIINLHTLSDRFNKKKYLIITINSEQS